MPNRNRDNMAYLDGIRMKFGNDQLRHVFRDEAEHDRERAANLINTNIRFPSLFLLRPEISKTYLYNSLNNKNRKALDISDEILTGKIDNADHRQEEDRETLHWMLHSGYQDDGMDEQYDQVLDNAALLLSNVHREKTCLKPIVEIIFSRHRKGFYTYDLIWAFFEASQPSDLLLIAEKLRSSHPRDVELARSLLNFVPCLQTESNTHKQYQCSVKWIKRNLRRLYYTGETNQQHSSPMRYALSNHHDSTGGGETDD